MMILWVSVPLQEEMFYRSLGPVTWRALGIWFGVGPAWLLSSWLILNLALYLLSLCPIKWWWDRKEPMALAVYCVPPPQALSHSHMPVWPCSEPNPEAVPAHFLGIPQDIWIPRQRVKERKETRVRIWCHKRTMDRNSMSMSCINNKDKTQSLIAHTQEAEAGGLA